MNTIIALIRKTAAVLLLAAFSLPLLVAASLLQNAYQSNAEDLSGLQDKYDRLRSIAAFNFKPLIQSDGQNSTKQLYLGEGAPAVLTSELQAQLREFAGQRGIEIMQASELEQVQLEGGLTKLGIRLEMSGPAQGVYSLLQQVSQSVPWLFIDNVQLRSNQTPGESLPVEPPLYISFDVSGIVETPPGQSK